MASLDDIYHTSIHDRFDAAIMHSTGLVLNPLEAEIAAKDKRANTIYHELCVLFADSPVELAQVELFKRRLQSVRRREENLIKQHAALKCPIGGRVFKDPVVAADGFLYERRNIQSWFDSQVLSLETSPITGKRVSNTNLTANREIRLGIKMMLSRN
jgi:hypothetical protein